MIEDKDVEINNEAQLPFDLERAKNGDEVEFKNVRENGYTGVESFEWLILQDVAIDDDLTVTGGFYIDNHLFNVEVEHDEHNEYLRMKYPQKANKDGLLVAYLRTLLPCHSTSECEVEWQDEKGDWLIVPKNELYLFHGIEHKLRMRYPKKVIK